MNSQFITFNACINGEQRSIYIHGHALTMNGFIINYEHEICGVAIGKNVLFLVFTDRNETGKVNSINNNISAYDLFTGEHLYDIGAVVPKSQTYLYASVVEAPEDDYPYQGAIKGHQILICSGWDRGYAVDVDEKRMIATFPSR